MLAKTGSSCLLFLFAITIQSMALAAKSSNVLTGQPASGDKFAVVVGINEYRSIPPLQYATADAKRLADKFGALGFTVILLENYDADPQHILATLHEVGVQMVASQGRENGMLVFAFSGHGFQQDGQNFLATGHADSSNLRQTALSLDRVKKVLNHSGIARKVLFIDACRNDPGKSGIDPRRRFVKDDSADGLAIMYSTGAGELSWEDSELGQSVFSYYLAEGLGGAASSDNVITVNNLYRYVSTKVAQHVFERFDRRQIPYTAGERSGDFTLGNVIRKTKTLVWRRLFTVAGVLAIGAVIAAAASSGSDSDTERPVTVVVPTP